MISATRGNVLEAEGRAAVDVDIDRGAVLPRHWALRTTGGRTSPSSCSLPEETRVGCTLQGSRVPDNARQCAAGVGGEPAPAPLLTLPGAPRRKAAPPHAPRELADL